MKLLMFNANPDQRAMLAHARRLLPPEILSAIAWLNDDPNSLRGLPRGMTVYCLPARACARTIEVQAVADERQMRFIELHTATAAQILQQHRDAHSNYIVPPKRATEVTIVRGRDGGIIRREIWELVQIDGRHYLQVPPGFTQKRDETLRIEEYRK